jgi:hypothetical protein
MNNLWAERTTWISAYWKEFFCARMTSTQRSESMDFVLKKGFVKEEHNLHIFAQQVNNCIQTRREAETAEAVASTVRILSFNEIYIGSSHILMFRFISYYYISFTKENFTKKRFYLG